MGTRIRPEVHRYTQSSVVKIWEFMPPSLVLLSGRREGCWEVRCLRGGRQQSEAKAHRAPRRMALAGTGPGAHQTPGDWEPLRWEPLGLLPTSTCQVPGTAIRKLCMRGSH